MKKYTDGHVVIWLDIETFGIGDNAPIIEVYAETHDEDPAHDFHTWLDLPREGAYKIEQYALGMHVESGLLSKWQDGPRVSMDRGLGALADWLKAIADGRKVMLAGSSINFDRDKLLRWGSVEMAGLLSRRVLDVSQIVSAAELLGGEIDAPPAEHDAISDVQRSRRLYEDALRQIAILG